MNMNRRMFFKSMGAATVAAAPISSALANVVSPKKWDQTCEVLVIGAGAAGLFAAVSAKESGAKSVVLLEKAVKHQASPALEARAGAGSPPPETGGSSYPDFPLPHRRRLPKSVSLPYRYNSPWPQSPHSD